MTSDCIKHNSSFNRQLYSLNMVLIIITKVQNDVAVLTRYVSTQYGPTLEQIANTNTLGRTTLRNGRPSTRR